MVRVAVRWLHDLSTCVRACMQKADMFVNGLIVDSLLSDGHCTIKSLALPCRMCAACTNWWISSGSMPRHRGISSHVQALMVVKKV